MSPYPGENEASPSGGRKLVISIDEPSTRVEQLLKGLALRATH